MGVRWLYIKGIRDPRGRATWREMYRVDRIIAWRKNLGGGMEVG